jgi:large subunit ribosomal protein L18
MPFNKSTRNETARARVKRRLRSRIKGTSERPRLLVFKSAKHTYAHIIDDQAKKTLMGVSTLSPSLDLKGMRGLDKAAAVGKAIAEKAKASGIEKVVFDRNGYKYHGRVKAVAEAAREAGLNF